MGRRLTCYRDTLSYGSVQTRSFDQSNGMSRSRWTYNSSSKVFYSRALQTREGWSDSHTAQLQYSGNKFRPIAVSSYGFKIAEGAVLRCLTLSVSFPAGSLQSTYKLHRSALDAFASRVISYCQVLRSMEKMCLMSFLKLSTCC